MSFDYGTFLKFGFPCYDSDFHQENDSQTPPGQALLLQQRLTEVNHPDHLIITYPDLSILRALGTDADYLYDTVDSYIKDAQS
jgi:hypothetical protein